MSRYYWISSLSVGEQSHSRDAGGRSEEEGVGWGGDAGRPVEQHEADGAGARPLSVTPAGAKFNGKIETQLNFQLSFASKYAKDRL